MSPDRCHSSLIQVPFTPTGISSKDHLYSKPAQAPSHSMVLLIPTEITCFSQILVPLMLPCRVPHPSTWMLPLTRDRSIQHFLNYRCNIPMPQEPRFMVM